MSLSSARNYALRASKSQDQKEAAELLSKAILELATSIEATDAKIKKINKSIRPLISFVLQKWRSIFYRKNRKILPNFNISI